VIALIFKRPDKVRVLTLRPWRKSRIPRNMSSVIYSALRRASVAV
jgi:hypothetical protein